MFPAFLVEASDLDIALRHRLVEDGDLAFASRLDFHVQRVALHKTRRASIKTPLASQKSAWAARPLQQTYPL